MASSPSWATSTRKFSSARIHCKAEASCLSSSTSKMALSSNIFGSSGSSESGWRCIELVATRGISLPLQDGHLAARRKLGGQQNVAQDLSMLHDRARM